jgi:hypothetical protein
MERVSSILENNIICLISKNHQQLYIGLIDVETNKTVQLTQPVWGINDQQVRLVERQKILISSSSSSVLALLGQ